MPSFVITSCDSPEVFQPVDGTFNDIASFVIISIEGCRSAATATSPQTSGLGISALWTNTLDAPPLNQLAGLPRTIGAIYPQARRTLSRASPPWTVNANGVKHRSSLRDISALASSDDHRERTGIAVRTQVNLGCQATSRVAQPLVAYGPLFSALAADFRAPQALRCALMCVESSAAPSQSIWPLASAFAWSRLRICCHVPLRDQRTKRS